MSHNMTEELYERETARHVAAGFTPDSGWTPAMQRRARRMRSSHREANKFYPGIPCYCCRRMAVEGSFFCENHSS